MRRVDDAVPAGRIRHRAHSDEIIGILLAADDANVICALGSNRIQKGLEAWSMEPLVRRSPIEPNRPGIDERLIEQVEQDGRIVLITRGYACPKGRAVVVGHGILLGGGSRGPATRPMEV